MIGRKIGFTNRTIWPEYGVYAPIWGYVFDRSLYDLTALDTLPLASFSEPRIEPEIVFGLSAAPSAQMDETALSSCIEWVALGFEIVQSIFPGWKFSAADTIAANGAARGTADRAAPSVCADAQRNGSGHCRHSRSS